MEAILDRFPSEFCNIPESAGKDVTFTEVLKIKSQIFISCLVKDAPSTAIASPLVYEEPLPNNYPYRNKLILSLNAF